MSVKENITITEVSTNHNACGYNEIKITGRLESIADTHINCGDLVSYNIDDNTLESICNTTTVSGTVSFDEYAYDTIYEMGEDKMTDRIKEAKHIYKQFVDEVINEKIEELIDTAKSYEVEADDYSLSGDELEVEGTIFIKDGRVEKLIKAKAVVYDLLSNWVATASLVSANNDIPPFDIEGAIEIINNYNE